MFTSGEHSCRAPTRMVGTEFWDTPLPREARMFALLLYPVALAKLLDLSVSFRLREVE